MHRKRFTFVWQIVALFPLIALSPIVIGEDKPKCNSQFGVIRKFATVPAAPGFPEGIVVDEKSVFVSGPASFATAGTGPSAIHVYDRRTGSLQQTITVKGEALDQEHPLSNIAIDKRGRIYALSSLGLIRFTKQGKNYIQEAFGAPLPNLPPIVGPDLPPIYNDIVFDDDGYAYVTDSFQATIFRYDPCGGIPQVWFQSPKLLGGGPFPFGPNGIRLDPVRKHIVFVNSTSSTNPFLGTIYRLPLVDVAKESDLQIVHEYTLGEFPDQIAFGEDGLLYVTLALSNQISILIPGYGEIGRISSAPTDAVPLDNPAGIAFDSRTKSLLIVNHSLLFPNPANFAVLKVFVDDKGDRLSTP